MDFPRPEAFETPVVVYLTAWCPYCIRARRLLDARGIAYTPVDVDGNEVARAWLRQTTRQSTVPQIFIHRRSVGGYDELSALDRTGALARLLAS